MLFRSVKRKEPIVFPSRWTFPMAKVVSASCDDDVILWSQEQARALRERDFLVHLLKWRFQPKRRSLSWSRAINHQRERIALLIKGTPSLEAVLREPDWRREISLAALDQASKETGVDKGAFPEASPWELTAALDPDFWPDV